MDISKETAAFKHAPLQSPRSFRILSLLPSKDFDSVVRCEIKEYSLDDHVKYEALSYAWGDSVPGHTILVGSKALSITPNCLEAMRYLRPRRGRGGREIWIDAVCIDQESSEKNHQVKLMGEIYSKAANVLAWMGPSDATTARSIRRLKLLGRLFEAYNQAPEDIPLLEWVLSSLQWQLSTATTYDRGKDLQFKPRYKAIASIIQSPWWSRLWTLQEQGLAGRCDILQGRHIIPFKRFKGAIISGYSTVHTIHEFLPLHLAIRVFNARELPGDVSQAMGRYGRGTAAQALLIATFHLLAKNPLDKVYGLHAMLARCGLPLADPDYSKSPENLYEETAWTWIESRKDLSILQIAACREPVEGLPSWVPAWHKPRDITDDEHFSWDKDDLRSNLYAGHSDFYARHSPGALELRGRYLGKISYAGFHAENGDRIKTYQTWCRQARKHFLGGDFGQFDLKLEEMFETLIHPHLQSRIQKEGDFEIFRRWFEIMIYPEGNPGPWTSELPAEVLSAGEQAAFSIERWSKDAINLIKNHNCMTHTVGYSRGFRNVRRSYAGRFFFLLDVGMMGMADPWFEAGDEIYLFPGSDCPFMLRRTGGSHRLVAPAYMPRMMTKEALSNFDERDVRNVTLN